MSRPPVLVIPAAEPGRGGGHLIRCAALVRELRSLGREAWLLLPPGTGDMAEMFGAPNFDAPWRVTEPEARTKNWDWIILDRFQTPPQTFAQWSAQAPLVGIDEGGPCRDHFDFLIDILPGLPNRSKPNIAGVSLLPGFKKGRGEASPPAAAPDGSSASPLSGGRRPPQRPLKILISFGQEDAAALGPAAAQALAAKKGGAPLDITLLKGGLFRRGADAAPEGVRLLEPLPQLGEHLAEYDLLITHYGITAFEALHAGTPVLLVSPTAYHEKLARSAGFYSAGPGKKGAARAARLLLRGGEGGRAFIRYLHSRCAACAVRHGLDREPGQRLAELVNGFTPLVGRNCPVCGAPLSGPVRGRGPDRSFRRCGSCGALGMIRLSPPPIEYAREYFFTFYQKQYGKTYIEDFPHLIAMGKRRLGIIKSLLPPGTGGRLLDIGCAYGPFLAAAREAGFSPFGIDPAEDAVRYVKERLGIPAVRGFFPGCPLPPAAGGNGAAPRFDVISLWYVIEHFRDCVPVFAEIRRLLKPGGVLAFSTPSYTGISGRSSFGRFLAGSPADHWSLWSPGVCKKALARAGFRVQRIVSTGHHPERFPLRGAWARGPLYRLLLAASTVFALGDTFEVYARADEHTD